MQKRERQQDLRKYPLADQEIEVYLLANSNLPGKRGNLELAFSFADFIEENYNGDQAGCWKYCLKLISENREGKRDLGNEKFLPFCAVVALGRIGRIDKNKKNEVMQSLR